MAGRFIRDLDESCGEPGYGSGTRSYAHSGCSPGDAAGAGWHSRATAPAQSYAHAWSLVRRYTHQHTTRHRCSRNHTCAHGPTQQHDRQHTAGHRHCQARVYPDCDGVSHSHAVDV